MTNSDRLPAEIWYKVFEQVNQDHDLVDLWMTYRNVCKTWRTVAEAVFREKHLPEMSIDFQLGTSQIRLHPTRPIAKYIIGEQYLRRQQGHGEDKPDFDPDDDTQPTYLALSCDFDHVSDDKNVAHFRMDGVQNYDLPTIKSIISSYTETEKLWWTSFMTSEPHHYIQIRRECNDTLLYGTVLDWEKREISIDWRRTVTAFFREEKLYHTLLSVWSKKHQAWSAKLGDKVTRGEMSIEAVLGMVVKAFGKGSEDCYKEARRMRFRECFRRDEKQNFSDENFHSLNEESAEKAVLKKLKEIRFLAGIEEDSDEEDDSGDEDEEDEWEDEDVEEEGEEDDDVH